MGLLDKLKAGAEQAKEIASEGVEKAKQEAKELQLRREIGQAEAELGRTAFDLAEKGVLTHAEVAPGVERIRSLKAELAAVERGADETPETPAP